MMHKYSTSIVGARGYTGLELARILLRHPASDLKFCYATSGFSLSSYIGGHKAEAVSCLPDSELMKNLTDVVFLATPAEVSMELAPKILNTGKKVVDLSGAFRLKTSDYNKWYGFEHTSKEWLKKSEYGLLPFAGPVRKDAKLIANPGCYASAVTMALIPLLQKNLIDPATIVIDAKSGTSGGGKKAAENLLFTEVDGECLPYKVGKHQHLPEIIEAVKMFANVNIDPFFTTSLLPTRRGIIASIFAKTTFSVEEIERSFQQAYGENSLVKFGSVKKSAELLSLKKVLGTAKTHISYEVVDGKLFLFSTIDNLLKGAASQAVENFNRLNDQPPETGLDYLEAMT